MLVVAICLSFYLIDALIFFYIVSQGLSLQILSSASFRDGLIETGIHANDLGVIGALVLTMTMFMLVHNIDRRMRWLLLLTAVVAGGLLFISFSRGAFVAFLVGLCAFLVSQRRIRVILVTVFVLAALVPLIPGELYERLGTGLNTGGQGVLHSKSDPITAGRVAGVWLPLFPEVLKHPLFGNGLNSTAWSDPLRNWQISIESINPHNLYLKAALDVGIVGLGLFTLFFLDLRRRFSSVASDPKSPPLETGLFKGGAAAMLGYAAFGLSGGDYLPTTSNVYLWLLFGLLLGKRADSTPANQVSG
jgi:O-antigen ligase